LPQTHLRKETSKIRREPFNGKKKRRPGPESQTVSLGKGGHWNGKVTRGQVRSIKKKETSCKKDIPRDVVLTQKKEEGSSRAAPTRRKPIRNEGIYRKKKNLVKKKK